MTGLPAKLRLFVAVDVTPPVRERLQQAQKELCEEGGDAIRWTPLEQLHLTLRFFGDVATGVVGSIETALFRVCENRPSFELRAVGLGGFPNLRRPRVIWAGVKGEVEALASLQREIERTTGDWGQTDAREFSPHLTLGRVRDGRRITALAEKLSAMTSTEFGNWRVSQVRLMQSQLSSEGARHTELALIKLC